MAKRKKKKETKKGFAHSTELYGVLLVLAAILGIGRYGPVGNMIASFAIFLVGVLYNPLLVVLLILGAYLIINRSWPNLFTTKMLGIYLLLIGVLVLMHENFILQNDSNAVKVFSETTNQLINSFSDVMKGARPNAIGGGIIGCTFGVLFMMLFSYRGMQIIAWTLIIIGFSLFTGFSIIDFVKDKAKAAKEKFPKRDKSSSDDEEEVSTKKPIITGNEEQPVLGEIKDDDKKIVISSIDELTKAKVHEDTPKEDATEVSEVNVVDENKVTVKHNYVLPPITLLDQPKKKKNSVNQSLIEKNIEILEKVLKDFNIIGKVVEVHIGPTVTQYELELHSGTKVSKLLSIHREIALAIATKDVRIQAPIPGKNTVGIEIANKETSSVSFREVLEKVPKSLDGSKLLCPLGKNIMGNVIWCEINKTPHLLVAGSTGSGKSVCINGIICSILMRAKPDEVKLVMVDPKKVELSGYNGVPHLMRPVVTDPKEASVALAKIVSEMERRYDTFSETKTKNIATYNDYVEKMNKTLPADEQMKKMPFIVVIIDELADLMLVASKDVEASIMRITQMARAAGIHLIIATQRPSTDVITGVVKANIPSRISFAVSSSIDSRTILDMTGAEKLLGKGDMLFLPMGEADPERIQGAFISDDEIKRIIDYTIEQQKAEYDQAFMDLKGDSEKSASQKEDMRQEEEYDDPLYNEIVEFVIESQKASASLLQRRFKLGYNRAARIIDLLEERGIIGPPNGSKPREVLVKLDEPTEE
ncbi:MAG TPA: cell division protein FtsK [Candidatus Onthousia excrementipullorum]|uniref:Cell division protein FtsK n=1 Tax=Candidatus Onthousia excrementipullorum TaxID=2840884 RepID=A0A9D1DT59_9FIRM|nr:cell division protein FtsK [Candidatus Onthousia excrementipullorum]